MNPMVATRSQAPLNRAGASRVESGCIVHRRSTQAASAALTAKTERNLPAIALGQGPFVMTLPRVGQMTDDGFAVLGHEGVEID